MASRASSPGPEAGPAGGAGPRRRPRQERSRATVERILAAARRILARGGAEALNTNRIAAEAGLGVGSVYEYFPGKEAIAARLLEDLAAEEAERTLAALERLGAAPLAALVPRMVEATHRLYRETAPLHDALAAIVPPDRRRTGTRPAERRIIEAIRARIAAHEGPLAVRDPALAAEVVFHLVESLAHRFARGAGERAEEARLRGEVSAAVLRYLGAGAG